MRWGLIPSWAKDSSGAAMMIQLHLHQFEHAGKLRHLERVHAQ